MRKFLFAAGAACVASSSFAWTLDKTADLGPYWNPLGVGGTGIYADSFIYNGTSGLNLGQLGVHIQEIGGTTGQQLNFFLVADSANSPTATVLSSSVGSVSTNASSLTLLTANMSSFSMVNGIRYWVAIQGLGDTTGLYQVGASTQNSVQNDNGTFWYSNPNSLSNFDGHSLTPEMAIYVNTAPVPEPMSIIVLGAGLVIIARRRRRA